jgi:calcium/calmodulin-dependent protein kinase I
LITDIKDLSVCITDLGMACRLSDETELKIKCGTPGYVAPEILRQRKATTKADVFSLGILLFNMLTGLSLFRGVTALEILTQNKYANPANMINMMTKHNLKNVSPDGIALLIQMTSPDPHYRPSAEQCL